jgi:hypothetical protein
LGQVTRVKACVASTFRASLSLAVRERFVSVTVTDGGSSQTYKASGRHTRVPVSLGRRGHVAVRFVEQITVRGHRERISFTRIYRTC